MRSCTTYMESLFTKVMQHAVATIIHTVKTKLANGMNSMTKWSDQFQPAQV